MIETSNKSIKQHDNFSMIGLIEKLDFQTDDVYSQIFSMLHENIPFDAGTLYLFDFDEKKLKKVHTYKQDVEILTGLHVDYGDGLSGWSAESAQTIMIADRTKKKSYNPDTDFASFMSIPILHNSKLYGVINLGSFTKNSFLKSHVNIIESGSSILSMIIEHQSHIKKFNTLKLAYNKSVEQQKVLQEQFISESTAEKFSIETANVIHGINNSLSIILGNLQCLLIGKNELNQKSLSRLKRIEVAAKKISESNEDIMNLNALVSVDSKSKKTISES